MIWTKTKFIIQQQPDPDVEVEGWVLEGTDWGITKYDSPNNLYSIVHLPSGGCFHYAQNHELAATFIYEIKDHIKENPDRRGEHKLTLPYPELFHIFMTIPIIHRRALRPLSPKSGMICLLKIYNHLKHKGDI